MTHLPLQFLRYLLMFPIALIGSLIGIIFSPLIGALADDKGNLPKYLRWFQTTDATMYDTQWVYEHPKWSHWLIATTWEQRNPFYGGLCRLGITINSEVRTFGNRNIHDGINGTSGYYFLLSSNAFEFKLIIPFFTDCTIIQAGWNLHDPLHKTAGQYIIAPLRFYRFGV
jgi:hypothetical protein